MRDQVCRDVGRHAEHQLHHARRQPGIDVAPHQLGAGGRRLLRPLDDDRAARRQRNRDLAVGLVDREVPRREGRHRPNRLAQGELVNPLRPGRDDAAVGAPGLLGKPVDDVGAGHGLHPRLGQRLALLEGHQAGDVVGPLAQQVGGAAQQLGALEGGHPAPGGEAPVGRGQGDVEVGPLGMGDGAVHLAGGRVHHVQRLAVLGCGPGAVDMQHDIGIHRASSFGADWVWCRLGLWAERPGWSSGSANRHVERK